jgi:itaconate CoA-transferase
MRQHTGRGTVIDISLFEALSEWMGFPAYYTMYSGEAPARTAASHAGVAPYGPFQSGDQKPVFLSVQNEREWNKFCQIVLRRPELETDPRFASTPNRLAHRNDLDLAINEVFGQLTAAEIVRRLEEAQIANARMNSMQEFLQHPQLAARNRWREIDSPVGDLAALIPPADIEGVEPVMGAVPAVGQHTDDILSEIGFDASTIAAWRQQGVV